MNIFDGIGEYSYFHAELNCAVLNQKNILAVGEVLFDIIGNEPKLGGAPFNVGAHMTKLGNSGYILSSVGNDELGERIFHEAEKIGIHTDFLSRHDHLPTGTVPVIFKNGEPQYEIREPVAWDEISVSRASMKNIGWSVVAFGSLAQRSRHNQEMFRQLSSEIHSEWVYFDCNLRQEYFNESILRNSLQAANISKFNQEEVRIISKMLYGREMEPAGFSLMLSGEFGTQIVLFTHGSRGASAWYEKEMYSVQGLQVTVNDTVGAGDAFSAGFLHGLIHGASVEKSLGYGNQLGAFVASRSGAIPEYTPEIREIFKLPV